MTLIKICGMTTPHDAELAVDVGADFLGLIFVPESPRYVCIKAAKAILQAVKGRVITVGVFQNSPMSVIQTVLSDVSLDMIQLHGLELPIAYHASPVPVIKAFSFPTYIDKGLIQPHVTPVPPNLRYLLFDKPKNRETFHWLEGAEIPINKSVYPLPVFLAGKLTVETVGGILERVQPDGVDVAAGVEREPGRKDPARLKDFCQVVQTFSQRPSCRF